jgi:hypothetical protein
MNIMILFYLQVCPWGSYCPRNTSTPIICPPGSFCLQSTRYSNEYMCPKGTYSPHVGLHNESSCLSCTSGMYCEGSGLTAPTGNCTAGYFCGGGSSVATPFESGESSYRVSYIGDTCVNDTLSNDLCPRGHYCPR